MNCKQMLRNGVVLMCALALAGCVSIGPNYVPPTLPMSSGFATKTAKSALAVAPTTAWWKSLRDKPLDGLIDEALAANLDVAEAIERVFEAKATARVNDAGAYPAVSSEASYTRQSNATGGAAGGNGTPTGVASTGNSDNDEVNEFSLQANASWEIDLFGRYRRQREVGRADIAAAQEDANAARLSLLSNLAETYVRARGYQARLAIARETVVAWRSTLELTQTKFAAGAVSGVELAQAEAEVASTNADIPSIETSLRDSAMDLGVLLGTQPEHILPLFRRGGRIPHPSATVGAGIPADLLRNRPDIRTAERKLAAATAQIGVGVAELYPSLTLSGLVSTVVSTVAKLGTGGTVSWSFGPTIDVVIFDGGQRRAQVGAYRSQARQRYLTWKSAVLNAVADVEKALAAYVHERRRKAALERSVKQYAIATRLADERYREGSGDFLDVLEARRSLYAARDALAQSEVQVAVDYIALNVALGGGWNAASIAQVAGSSGSQK